MTRPSMSISDQSQTLFRQQYIDRIVVKKMFDLLIEYFIETDSIGA